MRASVPCSFGGCGGCGCCGGCVQVACSTFVPIAFLIGVQFFTDKKIGYKMKNLPTDTLPHGTARHVACSRHATQKITSV
jgi:hypothetical protein